MIDNKNCLHDDKPLSSRGNERQCWTTGCWIMKVNRYSSYSTGKACPNKTPGPNHCRVSIWWLPTNRMMMVSRPSSCIVDPWTRNQKSALRAVPGSSVEYCHALRQGIVERKVRMVTHAVIVPGAEIHCDEIQWVMFSMIFTNMITHQTPWRLHRSCDCGRSLGRRVTTSDGHGCPAGSFGLARTRTRKIPVPWPRVRDSRQIPRGLSIILNIYIYNY